ncbi:S8 family serine peptidase, partial [Streptomyces noursei]
MARPLAHPRNRRLRALAVPLGLALTATTGFLPDAAGAAPPDSGPLLSYVVNTAPGHATVDAVERAIDRAGGKVITAHERIGVIVAHAANPRFAATLRTVPGVQSAGATRTAPLKQSGTTDVGRPQKITAAQLAAAQRTAKATGEEPLEPLQWDIPAIGADRAAKVNPGSRKVTVGVIDTGVDDTHPDLKPNFSARQSANCVGGVPDTSPGAWRPYDPVEDAHGTHVAGTIAAARNGIGVAGVAPGVKVSAIKVSEPKTSLFYAESVVCAFVFAADHGIQVTNNSYYVDPWMFNCKDDADQAAIVDAVGRAAKYAQDKGVVNVAAAGN